MTVTRKKIEKNLAKIRENIAKACEESRRDPSDVKIVAVTKSVDVETIKNLLDAGLTTFGENKVQQLTQRAEELAKYLKRRRNPLPAPVSWHMIGHLQRNKVKQVVKCASMIHSVDSLRLAEELSNRAVAESQEYQLLLQVNCSQENQKFGCAVGASLHLAEMIATLPGLKLRGLMTMGPMTGEPVATENSFVRLRELFEEIRHDKIGGSDFTELSMGMSGDYEIAVRQGATIVRIGSALFE